MHRAPGTAVVLIDVINALDFPGSASLVRAARRAAPQIEALSQRAREEGVPVVYVNDNFGRWSSDFKATLAECTKAGQPGRSICERLRPVEGDYFVLKPQHSGFYATPLDRLLEHLGVQTLVIAGFAANLCVLFTANDAHMRGYQLIVPRDCTASNTTALTKSALQHVRVALHGAIPRQATIRFDTLRSRRKKPRGQAF